jgi:hypothetical protein
MMLFLDESLDDVYLRLAPRRPRLAQRTAARLPGNWHEQPRHQWPFAMEHPDTALPRAVIFRDSFATALVPLLAEHFRRSVYVWKNAFDTAVIEREKPDFVIHELVERCLVSGPTSGLP